jgi:hypothetical protein
VAAAGGGNGGAAGSDVLLAMYERIQEVAGMRALPMLADVVFGIPVGELLQCRGCNRVSQQAAYMQYFFNTQVGCGCWGWQSISLIRRFACGHGTACLSCRLPQHLSCGVGLTCLAFTPHALEWAMRNLIHASWAIMGFLSQSLCH